MKKPTLLIASSNKNKIRELKHILKDTNFEIISPADIGGIQDVEETGSTFEENAILKAATIATHSHLYVFADDSGLEVEALNNRPGILSSRYAGINTTYPEKIKRLLKELENKKNRNARFVCVIAISSPKGEIKTFRGEISGKITFEQRGENGFGYDPIFQPNGYEKTFAELDNITKNKISHRAIATQKATVFLNNEYPSIK